MQGLYENKHTPKDRIAIMFHILVLDVFYACFASAIRVAAGVKKTTSGKRERVG